MDILTIIKNRRSVRKFQSKQIPNNIINKLIEALIWAPSAGHLQSRKFYFIYNLEIKEKLVEAALGQSFIAQAPLVVVACTDDRIEQKYGQRGKELYTICDTAMSVQNMLLVAYEQGLGSVVVGAFDKEQVSAILNIPSHLHPIMIIPVGYPAEKPTIPLRVSKQKAVKEIE
jgi:nitroreductase